MASTQVWRIQSRCTTETVEINLCIKIREETCTASSRKLLLRVITVCIVHMPKDNGSGVFAADPDA